MQQEYSSSHYTACTNQLTHKTNYAYASHTAVFKAISLNQNLYVLHQTKITESLINRMAGVNLSRSASGKEQFAE